METLKADQALKDQILRWTSVNNSVDDRAYLMDKTPIPEHNPQAKLIKWVDGKPVPITDKVLTPDNIQDVASCAISLPYTAADDTYDLFPELYGLTYLEVAFIKTAQRAASGDIQALETILDRTVGKPKQSIERKTLTVTYQDLLDSINDASDNSSNPSHEAIGLSDISDAETIPNTSEVADMEYTEDDDLDI